MKQRNHLQTVKQYRTIPLIFICMVLATSCANLQENIQENFGKESAIYGRTSLLFGQTSDVLGQTSDVLAQTGEILGETGEVVKGTWNENRVAVQGCMAGAVPGGLSTHLMSRSKSGTAVSALVSCALGIKAGVEFEKRRKEHSDLQAFQSAELKQVRNKNSKLEKENNYHEDQAVYYAKEIEAASKLTSGKAARFSALQSELSASLNRANNSKDDALIEIAIKDELAEQLEAAEDIKGANALRAEADEYQKKIDALSGLIEGYNRQTAQIGGLV